MSAYDFLCDIRKRQKAALYEVSADAVDDPAVEPVTLEQARAHCRVDTYEDGSPPETVSDDDDWLNDIGIPAAREYCELTIGRALAERTMRVVADSFPGNGATAIPLPFGPVRSIVSVVYLDGAAAQDAYDAAYDAEFLSSADEALATAAGEAAYAAALSATMPSADYTIDTASTPNRLILAYGATWPTSRGDHASVTVTYTVGYDDPADSPLALPLPKTAKAAMCAMLAHLYEHRGDDSISVPPLVDSLLSRVPHREVMGFA